MEIKKIKKSKTETNGKMSMNGVKVSQEKTVIPETDEGTVLFNVPFPKELDERRLKDLENYGPIIIKQPYQINYLHSYGQDSPFFAGLANKKLLGTECEECHTKFATPRLSCTECGSKCKWVELPQKGKIHTFTICYFGSEAFLKETPFVLALIEFPGFDTCFLTRIVGVDPNEPDLDWVGMNVKAKFVRNSKFSPTDVYFVPEQ